MSERSLNSITHTKGITRDWKNLGGITELKLFHGLWRWWQEEMAQVTLPFQPWSIHFDRKILMALHLPFHHYPLLLRAAASAPATLSFRALMSAAFPSSLTPHMLWCHYMLSLSNVILPSFSRLTVVVSNTSNNASLNEEQGIEVSMTEIFSC